MRYETRALPIALLLLTGLVGAEQSDDEELARLIGQLKYPNRSISGKAAAELAKKGAKAVAAVAEVLKEKSSEARAAAAAALGGMGAEAAEGVPALLDALRIEAKTGAPSGECSADFLAKSIVRIDRTGARALEGVRKILREGDALGIRNGALLAGLYGDRAKEAVPDLVVALKSGDEGRAKAAAAVLAQWGERARDALPALREIAGKGPAGVRDAAATAARAIEPSPAAKPDPPSPPSEKAVPAVGKEDDAFDWALKEGQELSVELNAHYKQENKIHKVAVKGTLTLGKADADKTAGARWKVDSLSYHHRFVDEQSVAYSGGRWTQVSFIRHVAFDEADRARKQLEDAREFRKRGGEWAREGGVLEVTIGPAGFQVSSSPVGLDYILNGCWPYLSLPPKAGEPVPAETSAYRFWHTFASQVEKNDVKGRWTSTGSNPVYVESGPLIARWDGFSGQKVVESARYSRTTTASKELGGITSVKEEFSVSSVIDGKPAAWRAASGNFSLILRKK